MVDGWEPLTVGMIGVTWPFPFRGAMVLRDCGRPKDVILLEAASRSPGPFGIGELMGLRRGLTPRLGKGLPAGLRAFDRRGLLPDLDNAASLAPATGDGMIRERCGLAVGRGEPLGRILFGLPTDLVAIVEPKAALGRVAGAPARGGIATALLACRGCGEACNAGAETPG